MNSAIRHRGPDDEGFFLAGEGGRVLVPLGGEETNQEAWSYQQSSRPVGKIDAASGHYFLGLGHRRLSILDLTARGHQPASDLAGTCWLVFNGEIYNFREIRRELSHRGYAFQTDSDTEVLLASYLAWGRKCLDKLEGMWSFALYDASQNRLLLARDRFGIKPLYYWVAPSGDFYFASEIKQFTGCKQWRSKLETQSASDFLLYSLTDHQSGTLFQNVSQVRAGHYLEIEIEEFLKGHQWRPAPTRWYELPNERFRGDQEEAQAEFRTRFLHSVSEHLIADVPVGTALSGGVDSTAIACSVNKLLQERNLNAKLATFSSCALDPAYDESPWVKAVLAEIPAEPYLVYPKGEDIFKLSEKLIWQMDEPYQSQSAFLAWHVFERAKLAGVKVVLNGQGADEYTSCYGETANFINRTENYRLSHPMRLLRQLFRSPNPGWRWHFNQLISGSLPFWLTNSFRRLSFPSEFPRAILNERLLGGFTRHPYSLDNYQKRSISEITRHQLHQEPLPKYLRWEDRNSMAHSVEARVPFLDRRLVEFTRSLPANYLVDSNRPKKIITESLGGILPNAIRNRPDKVGFISSEERWFMKDFHNEFVELLESNIDAAQGIIVKSEAVDYFAKVKAGKIPFSYGYWRIILFCMWMRVFKVEL